MSDMFAAGDLRALIRCAGDTHLVPALDVAVSVCSLLRLRLRSGARVGHELADLLSTAAGNGDLGSPPERLSA